MGYNIEQIKQKLLELNGKKKISDIQMWKPDVGTYKIRCLPWPSQKEGQPFEERWFYYLNGKTILAPYQFDKPDPVNELRIKLYQSGSQDDKLIAKQLFPKMRSFAPVIVRGEEDKGVLVWSIGQIIYQKLLQYFLDEEVGDILDVENGYDLKVTISKITGKQFLNTDVEAVRKSSPVITDVTKVTELLKSIPNIDNMYQLHSYDEIKTMLDAWLKEPKDQVKNNVKTDGTIKGPEISNEIDELVKSVQQVSSEKKTSSLTNKTPKTMKDLDAAFEDLIEEEN